MWDVGIINDFCLTCMQDYEIARDDLERALQLDPSNQAVKQKLAVLSSRVRNLNSKYAAAMKKMFH